MKGRPRKTWRDRIKIEVGKNSIFGFQKRTHNHKIRCSHGQKKEIRRFADLEKALNNVK